MSENPGSVEYRPTPRQAEVCGVPNGEQSCGEPLGHEGQHVAKVVVGAREYVAPWDDEEPIEIGFLPYRMPGDARTWLTAILRDAALQGWDADECSRRATHLLEHWRENDTGEASSEVQATSEAWTLHTAIAAGIKRGLADFGAELTGCTAAALTGHVIGQLREAGLLPSSPLPDSETERPRRCTALVPEGNVVTEGRQCQQYEGHPHDHTWYGDNGRACSAWSREVTS
jgi:hypothetical protein